MTDKAEKMRADALAQIAPKVRRELEDTRFDWIRSWPRRRVLALATSFFAALLGLGIALEHTPLMVLSLITYALLAYLGRRAVRAIVDWPDELLDERLLEIRNQVFRYAYLGLVCALSVALVLSISFYSLTSLMPTTDHVAGMLIGLFALAMSLPTIAYAWCVPHM